MFSRTNTCEALAEYAAQATWDRVAPNCRDRIKDHVLDSLGCALAAMGAESIRAIRAHFGNDSSFGPYFLIGGGSATPKRAAFYNTALTRYLDFMDTYITPGEACHPSDNIAGILAAATLANASGRDFLAAVALAYNIQWRLTNSGVPIMRTTPSHRRSRSLLVLGACLDSRSSKSATLSQFPAPDFSPLWCRWGSSLLLCWCFPVPCCSVIDDAFRFRDSVFLAFRNLGDLREPSRVHLRGQKGLPSSDDSGIYVGSRNIGHEFQ